VFTPVNSTTPEQGTSCSSTFLRSNALLWYVATPTIGSSRCESYPEEQVIGLTDASGRKLEGTVIKGFNSRLTEKIASFECSHPGVRQHPSLLVWRITRRTPPQVATYQWNSYSFFTKILDDPTKYGFPDSTSYGSDKYFWGNNYHPSCTKPPFRPRSFVPC
jgi:hypothetical protein